jgi:hypothetical protein
MASDLFYYMKQVERRAGLTVSSSFPTSPTTEQELVFDAINETLRYLNNAFNWIFKETEYTLTTTSGTRNYNLASAPYNQTMWAINRLARHGVRLVANERPLIFMPYEQLDYMLSTSDATPRYYSSYGGELILHPTPDGSQVYVRYYGMHIGTDSTGTTKKLTLSETDDLVFLEDQWQDVLVYGAAASVRRQQKIDEKYKELQAHFERLTNILLDMGNQPGDDAPPEVIAPSYTYKGCINEQLYYPFFSIYPGD